MHAWAATCEHVNHLAGFHPSSSSSNSYSVLAHCPVRMTYATTTAAAAASHTCPLCFSRRSDAVSCLLRHHQGMLQLRSKSAKAPQGHVCTTSAQSSHASPDHMCLATEAAPGGVLFCWALPAATGTRRPLRHRCARGRRHRVNVLHQHWMLLQLQQRQQSCIYTQRHTVRR